MTVFALNKRARFDYELLDEYEAGIVLFGYEVKSIREGNMHLKSAYVSVRHGELFLVNSYIGAYSKSGEVKGYNPERLRKLMLHKREIRRITAKLEEEGLTLVPIKVYNRNNRIKIQIAVARGKKNYDKRADKKKRDINRQIRRTLKQNM